jgi:DNA repair exonuclease SbcCD nuclease subunit
MAFRFVHAADVHLDSPLRSLALRNPELADLIGNATRQAFTGIIDLCLAEEVDALFLAGDLYDGDQTSMKTARYFATQLHRLDQAGIRVFIVRGNHDALSRITKELVLPESVKVFSGRAEAIPIESAAGNPRVVIHGLSFTQPHAPDSLLPRYKPPVEGAVNVGILHTSLAGAPGHDPYAPCSVADLRATDFRYWALGHVHKRFVADGPCTIVMPGNPQGRDINEAGARSVTLGTIADDGSIRIEERCTSVAQFERVVVDASGMAEWRDLIGAVAKAMERTRASVVAGQLVVRLKIVGKTPLAWRIRSDLDLLRADVEHRAAATGACSVEKLEIDCQPSDALPVSSGDPIAELRRLIESEIVRSDAFQREAIEIGEELRGQLPQECRHLLGADEAGLRDFVLSLARDGADDVLARLHAQAKAGEG